MSTKISLALSGGGMRGCAHIGVLRRLEELALVPEWISGTSIGSIIGVLKADGFSSEEIQEIFIKSKFGFDINYFSITEALFSSKRIEAILKKNLRSKTFDQLKTPLYVCVTNYHKAHPEFLYEGALLPAVMASSAIPLFYKPVKLNGTLYVDGGLSRNLPTTPLKDKLLPIIGVHVNPLSSARKMSMTQKIDHTLHLLLLEKTIDASKDCAIYIEPEKIIEIGYLKAKQSLRPELVLGLSGTNFEPGL
jgi:NTE family protein